MLRAICALLFTLALGASGARADTSGFTARPDGHAPIGVMGDHMHERGGLMLSFRWARVRMDGNRDGTHDLSARAVLGRGYTATPLDMDTDLFLLGLMGAPTDWLTLTLMLPYWSKTMDHLAQPDPMMQMPFTTESAGLGDLQVGGLLRLWENEHHHVHLNLGLSLPTGAIRKTDDTPAMAHATLPFPMQLGSGTVDLVPGLTYVGHARRLSWGGQVRGIARLGENHAGWTASDAVDATAWLAVPLLDWLSVSGRAAYGWWSNFDGDEKRPPPPSAIPTADPGRRGGQRLDLLPGLNLDLRLGPLGRQRFGIEAAFPVVQSLDGPQLALDWRVMVGWQKAFHWPF